MGGHAIVSKKNVLLFAFFAVLAQFLYRFRQKWLRFEPFTKRFLARMKEVEHLCGMACPQPWALTGPWYALLVFYRAFREHRHLHFLRDVHQLLGGTFMVPLPFICTYVITDKDANVEHVLRTNFDNYVKGDTFFIPRMMDVLGHGIFNADGPNWYQQRKTASHMFTQRKLTQHIWRTIQRNCDRLISLLQASKSGQAVDMFNIMNRFTLDTIGEIGFGRNIGALENADSPFLKSFDRAQQIMFVRLCVPLWRLRRFLRLGDEADGPKHFKLLKDYSAETVDDLKDNLDTEKGDSFVGLFMQDAKKTGKPYDDKFMQDMVLNFLIAGRDTTAQSLSWTFYLLLRHPEVERKVMEEIAAVLGNTEATYEDMNKLQYLSAVVSESLRLYPSVPMDIKYAKADDTLPDGTTIKKGDVFLYNIFAMGRSTEIWGDDADQFKPERWLDIEYPSLYTYPVFNAGPRECLGRRLAQVEMKACLVRVLQSVELKLAVPFDDIHYDAQLTLGMSSGLPCYVEAK